MDRIIDELPAEKMDEWEAMDRVVPIGTEKICWVVAIVGAQICNLLKMDENVSFQPKDFIPWASKKKKKAKPEYVSPNQAARMFQMAVRR